MRTRCLACTLMLAAAPARAQDAAAGRAPARWYAGASIGAAYGALRDGERSTHVSPGGTPLPLPLAASLRAGVVLGPRLLAGAELSGAYAENGYPFGDVTSVATASLLGVATVFVTAAPRPEPPLRATTSRGWFARAGAGVSRLHARVHRGSEDSSWTATGPSLLAGGGYALWMGARRGATVGVDVNRQWYRRTAAGERGLTLVLLTFGIDLH